uniref:HAT C-terminal dimerisation domain-containing protein n=1 Tax=Romanomermis culicivorax TaxID=13658 RepID=A0A915LAX0_ROMCU
MNTMGAICEKSDCQLFISIILQKLIKQCPLKYKLVRGLSALQPSTICASITIAEECFNICFKMLYEVNHISSTVADNARDQFTTLLNIGSFKEAAASFDELSDRFDDFWFTWAMKNNFNDLTFVIKMLLILSHGNATVESSFSINENLLNWATRSAQLQEKRANIIDSSSIHVPAQLKYSSRRVAKLGKELACAEWLLSCAANISGPQPYTTAFIEAH